MGVAADASCIQYRMLNRGKGPAVHSLRAQADRVRYKTYMKHALERQEKLESAMDRIRKKFGADAIVFGAARPEKEEDPLP